MGTKWVRCKSKKYGGNENNRKMEDIYNTPPSEKFFPKIIKKIRNIIW